MRLSFCFFTLAAGLLAAGVAGAGELDTLRATLRGMHASEPFAATLEVRNDTRGGDEDAPKTTNAHLELSVAVNTNGLQLGFSRALLKRVADEQAANARNPNQSVPTAELVRSIGPLRARTVVDFAPALLRRLEGAKLTTQRDEAHAGKPAHLLVFDVPAGLGKSDSDAVKHYKGELKIWLDTDGIPLAIDESRVYKGRKFFISFATSSAISASLERLGSRLIATRMRTENKGSGFGQSNDSVTTISVTPQTVPATSGSVSK